VQALADPTVAAAAAAHLDAMSDRYVRTTSPQRIAAHLRLIDRLRDERVATELVAYPEVGTADLVVVTGDVPGLFALIAGTLAAHGVNILSAQIETRADGLAVDTFHVNEPGGDIVWDARRWETITADLTRVVLGTADVETLVAARRPRRGPLGGGGGRVTVDNSLSDTHTVVEVRAPDRVGLLYLITRALAREALNVATAKIATDLDQALDTFYVTDRQGRRVTDPERIGALRAAITAALDGPPA
jgi:[protein-PII] uridylyltransferase